MSGTGNFLIDALSLLAACCPLLPALLIFFRSIYRKDILNFLMILCLLNFTKELLLILIVNNTDSQSSINAVFTIPEWILLAQIFFTDTPHRMRRMIQLGQLLLLTAIITWYIARGINDSAEQVQGFQNGIVLAMSVAALVMVVQGKDMRIFSSPVFWIATGTLFFFGIAFMLQLAPPSGLRSDMGVSFDRLLLSDISSLARYFFYTLAAILYVKPGKEAEGMDL